MSERPSASQAEAPIAMQIEDLQQDARPQKRSRVDELLSGNPPVQQQPAPTEPSEALRTKVQTMIQDKIKAFSEQLHVLRKKEIKLLHFDQHKTNNTLPADLKFKRKYGNPFPKDVPGQDQLREQEKAILLNAQKEILELRVKFAEADYRTCYDSIQVQFAEQSFRQELENTFTVDGNVAFREYINEMVRKYLEQLYATRQELRIQFQALDKEYAKRMEASKQAKENSRNGPKISEVATAKEFEQTVKALIEDQVKTVINKLLSSKKNPPPSTPNSEKKPKPNPNPQPKPKGKPNPNRPPNGSSLPKQDRSPKQGSDKKTRSYADVVKGSAEKAPRPRYNEPRSHAPHPQTGPPIPPGTYHGAYYPGDPNWHYYNYYGVPPPPPPFPPFQKRFQGNGPGKGKFKAP